MHSDLLQQGFIELAARSQAARLWPHLGFKDPAADVLLERLGQDFSRWSEALHCSHWCVARCAWLDQQLVRWLDEQPTSLCVEWYGGFSTGFWRVCGRLDWPQCRWLAIDPVQITRLKQRLLPRIDNFALSTPEGWPTNCANLAWNKGQPLAVIVRDAASQPPQAYPGLFELLNQSGPCWLALETRLTQRSHWLQPQHWGLRLMGDFRPQGVWQRLQHACCDQRAHLTLWQR